MGAAPHYYVDASWEWRDPASGELRGSDAAYGIIENLAWDEDDHPHDTAARIAAVLREVLAPETAAWIDAELAARGEAIDLHIVIGRTP